MKRFSLLIVLSINMLNLSEFMPKCIKEWIAEQHMVEQRIKHVTLDIHDRKIIEKKSPRTMERIDRMEPLTLNDIIKLTQSGICDEIIIDYLKQTNNVYRLSQTQIQRLQEGGVSQRVINCMSTGQTQVAYNKWFIYF